MRLEVLRRDSFPRAVLAVVVGADLLSFFSFMGAVRGRALAEGVALTTFAELVSRPAVSGSLILIGVAAAVAFGLSPGRLWAGLVALGALALLSTAHAELFGSPWRHLYYSGLCLSGWLLGLVVSRSSGAAEDESYARMGSTALLAAAYLNGGISKVAFGGWDWASGLPIQAIVVAQDGMVADSAVSAYRSWVAATPALACAFSVATIVLELAAPLMLAGRAIHIAVALGLLAMHLNILVLTHILYWEAMVFLVVFGLLPRRPTVEAATDAMPVRLFHGRPFVVSAVLLVACAAIGIDHQSRRFVLWQKPGSAAVPLPAAVDPLPEAVAPLPEAVARTAGGPDEGSGVKEEPRLQRVGPFSVGQTLIAGWSLDALELTEDGFIAMLLGEPGRVRFEVTCSSSPLRSPFDLGSTHIFYSNNVAFDDLAAAGWAFQRRLKEAGEGQALCDRLGEWHSAARAEQRH